MKFLEVKQVSIKRDSNEILKGINFVQKRFQHIAIAGETGSGKSSLLKVINGSSDFFEGEVLFNGAPVKSMSDKLVEGHRGVAYLSQHFELPKFLTVAQVLSYANLLSDEKTKRLYEICQIDHLLERKTDQVSGGEKQRIALARLLSTSPELLLLDEPFSNLDMLHKMQLKRVIEAVCQRLSITCILVSHDPSDLLSWADHIIVLKEGEIIQEGTPAQVYHQPVNTYVAGLFGSYQLLSTDSHFFNFGQIKNKTGKKILIRPEYIKVEPVSSKLTTAIIERIQFFGSYYEAVLKVKDQYLRVRLPSNHFGSGERVGISWVERDLWYL